MRARALRLSAATGIVAMNAWLAACGDVLPVDAEPSTTADASEDGGIHSDADATGDEIHAAAEASVAGGRVVFVTKGAFNGNLGGVDGADKKCQDAADASSKLSGRTFQAWISTSDDTVSRRLVHGETPYLRVDGTPIANNWGDLTDGTLAAPLNVDEHGAEIETENDGGGANFRAYVWTGTTSDGTSTNGTCGGWTSDGGLQSNPFGKLLETSDAWTNVSSGGLSCSTKLHLYCVER